MVYRPRTVRINARVLYYEGTGCLVGTRPDGTTRTIELTEAEMELFDLLRHTPGVTVPMGVLVNEMARSQQNVRVIAGNLAHKLGPTSIRCHRGIGYSLQPEMVFRGVIRVREKQVFEVAG